MLHCMNGNVGGGGGCSSVLERQRERIKYQQVGDAFFNNSSLLSSSSNNSMMLAAAHSGSELAQVVALSTNPKPTTPPFRTFSCPPSLIQPKQKKRKPSHKVVEESDKRIKVGGADDGESKIAGHPCSKVNNNGESCADTSNSNQKNHKPDYIHVRARRGQATDSHSLAERVRREKISERMKFLQDLVPGCNKITGKAGMLDEIINYVQSLQRQVEFLSMKLAAVNPRPDFNIDDLFNKEVFSACVPTFPNMEISSEMNNSSYLHYNSPQQIVSYNGLDTGINASDVGLRRTLSAPVSIPETFLDSSCFQQIVPSSMWESEFQNLYNNLAFDQERASNFPSQLFTGLVEAGNLKMEM